MKTARRVSVYIYIYVFRFLGLHGVVVSRCLASLQSSSHTATHAIFKKRSPLLRTRISTNIQRDPEVPTQKFVVTSLRIYQCYNIIHTLLAALQRWWSRCRTTFPRSIYIHDVCTSHLPPTPCHCAIKRQPSTVSHQQRLGKNAFFFPSSFFISLPSTPHFSFLFSSSSYYYFIFHFNLFFSFIHLRGTPWLILCDEIYYLIYTLDIRSNRRARLHVITLLA